MTSRPEVRRGPGACLRRLLACGVFGGLLAALAALPLVGTVGLTVNNVTRTLTDLPPEPPGEPAPPAHRAAGQERRAVRPVLHGEPDGRDARPGRPRHA
ncbi:hypothetical protein [Streptosporangium vulgare]|uniref:hypothetical protein n=1 Tax=Streptosporangium vulgare TaxID=46190 RepID=UPI0031D40540